VTEPELIRAVLIEGAIGGAVISLIALLASRFASDVIGRGVLAIMLIIAAGAYFGFAVAQGPGPSWTLLELAHGMAFGAVALIGWKGSVQWLAAGWALHPVWDIGLHYYGPGRSFAPLPYAIACISFDSVVALYIVVAYGSASAKRVIGVSTG
jgi:hypothetical protein